MFFDVGMTPIFSLLIATLVFAILSDFLLELFSVRMSLSTGRFQAWFFDHFGQNIFLDFVFAVIYQFFSFRKKSFFVQLSSLVNVGSFSRKQVMILSLGSLIGIGLSSLVLFSGNIVVGAMLCLVSLILGMLAKDQIKDFGVALFSLGLFLISLTLFNEYLMGSSFGIHQFKIEAFLGISLVVLTTVLFRSSLPFLLFLALMHFFVDLKTLWFPLFFLINAVLGSGKFYWLIVSGKKRLRFFMLCVLSYQLLQFAMCFGLGLQGLVTIPVTTLTSYLEPHSFLSSFRLVLISYFVYYALPLVVLSPFVFLLSYLPFFTDGEVKKSGSQKIILDGSRGNNFSIHLSLFLLRQEFKKYTTSVHTIFKFSREADDGEEKINQKFVRYQGMLTRVGDELKELCFSIGRQRSYRWQVKEVMSYYRYVNQLELLVEDLGYVTSLLREQGQDEEWEKDCRYWLGLQLKIFESFFNFTVGVGKDDSDKVKVNIEKSYEFLDRFFGENQNFKLEKHSSQTFYRITESIANLAR